MNLQFQTLGELAPSLLGMVGSSECGGVCVILRGTPGKREGEGLAPRDEVRRRGGGLGEGRPPKGPPPGGEGGEDGGSQDHDCGQTLPP